MVVVVVVLGPWPCRGAVTTVRLATSGGSGNNSGSTAVNRQTGAGRPAVNRQTGAGRPAVNSQAGRSRGQSGQVDRGGM